VYTVGLVNGVVGNGSYWAAPIWVYVLAPFIGAFFAPFFLRLVSSMDRAMRHEESPMKVVERPVVPERIERIQERTIVQTDVQ
jgi:H+/Cl- antiporter ClcA